MRQLLNLFVSFCLVVFVSGCSTIKDAKDSLDESTAHYYKADFDSLWQECIDVINDSELDLVYDNKEKGDVLAQRSISAFSWGENVFVNILKLHDSKVQVKVSSKRAFSGNLTAENWDRYIHSKLSEKYKKVEM